MVPGPHRSGGRLVAPARPGAPTTSTTASSGSGPALVSSTTRGPTCPRWGPGPTSTTTRDRASTGTRVGHRRPPRSTTTTTSSTQTPGTANCRHVSSASTGATPNSHGTRRPVGGRNLFCETLPVCTGGPRPPVGVVVHGVELSPDHPWLGPRCCSCATHTSVRSLTRGRGPRTKRAGVGVARRDLRRRSVDWTGEENPVSSFLLSPTSTTRPLDPIRRSILFAWWV